MKFLDSDIDHCHIQTFKPEQTKEDLAQVHLHENVSSLYLSFTKGELEEMLTMFPTEEEVNPEVTYMIGQRVIFSNVICTIVPRIGDAKGDDIWIKNPDVGYKHWVALDNIKPLPNGQL